ncbi:MAG TPA: signal recognition particle-docking protein FtsY [Ignavibacteriales bacterium]|nr:signal recognition particle-docking protein FtsY [Ignavibacteriales bacterium]HOL80912.1 signal recognition particle-docking protein FtsY [Ignavibacteriales bacterium]HOM64647.1 signal recognition particle-docking protein FtsY [Ignavibacteriales bacterium]HPD66822.1 signal recognition particle-docking protein FtsY [Ignavibacteriales bacterium]HPP32692.1 signal recognition particle-docking protein FtsY [Ignavibacteriales bacterium]
MGFFSNFSFNKVKEGLQKTKSKIVDSITELVTGKAVIDETTLEKIEEILITSDIGYVIAEEFIENVRKELKKSDNREVTDIIQLLQNHLTEALNKYYTDYKSNIEKFKPFVIMIVGVNGVGKTTTIGKLANNFKNAGYSVLIGSADTFRAAANDQLEIWAKRANVEIVQKHQGADPSAVVYDTIQTAIDKKIDIVLIDTAGRLHTKTNLMEELKKLKKTSQKLLEYAPNEVWLVVDATTGQNANVQAEEFKKYTDLTGLVVTKLDGTAKGGVIFNITQKHKIPVRYIGVGEGINDLQDFIPDKFVEALFNK